MNERVLVIDDDAEAVQFICDALNRREISCRSQMDPRAAIADFLANPTDVVIVDYHFPPGAGLTGVEVIREMQNIKPFTQFILISGMINKQLGEEALTRELQDILRANRYIPKPIVSTRPIVEAVQDALRDIEDQAGDWTAIAQQHMNIGSVTPEEVRLLNEKIKAHLIEAIDRNREDA